MNMLRAALAGLVLCISSFANAGVITETDFSGSETIIDFNSILNTQSISSQYVLDGITFNGALLGMTNFGDVNLHNGSTIASNWCYACGSLTGSTWSATFSSLQNLLGFSRHTNIGDGVTVELFSGVTSLSSNYFASGPVDFIGVNSLIGFDRVVVTIENNNNGFFSMDNFLYEFAGSTSVPEPSTVPEPASLAIFALGIMGLASRRFKKQSKI